MKRFACILAVAVLLISAAMAETIDLTQLEMTDLLELQRRVEEEIASRQRNSAGNAEIVVFEDAGHRVVYKDNYVVTQYGRSYSVVEFYYTNTGTSNSEIGYTASFTQYQDGVELQWGILLDYPTETGTEIRPGVTIVVRDIAQLRNANSPVELVVDRWLDLSNTHDDFTITLPLNNN